MSEEIKVWDTLSPKERDAVDIFFGLLDNYSTSNEMITTWLGRNPQEGGKVIIGWNQLNAIMWKCIGISKGLVEVPPEILEILHARQNDPSIFRKVNPK